MSINSLLKLSKLLIILFLLLFNIKTEAQLTQKNYKILGISVQGNKSADANTIIANSGLKVGNEIQIPGDQTIAAIKQLWALNIFSDVQIVIEREISDGAFLLIIVDEYPRIERYIIEGNDGLSKSDIEKVINFTTGQILKPQDVVRTVNRIISLYQDEGYQSANVSYKYYIFESADTIGNEIKVRWRNEKDFADEELQDYVVGRMSGNIRNRVLLKFVIEENDRAIVRKIRFEGNEFFDDSDLRGAMKEIETSKWWKFWSRASFDKKKFEDDKKAIKDFYLNNGFRDAEVLSDSIILYNNNKDMEIVITVYEGTQYKIRNIEWEGNTIYPDALLTERLDFQKGDIFDYEKFQRNLRGNERQNDVSALYYDNGYLTFQIRTEEIKVAPDSIDLLITISERNRFHIGRVDITGNDKTKDKVIRRELYTIPGDYFNRAMLFRSLQQLANLQFFNAEKLYTEGVDYQISNDSTVNIVYQVEEKSSDYLNASVGYSGSFGFSGAVGVTLTNFSIAEPFSLGGGQILSFNWQFGVGNIYRTFSIGFTEPWLYDTPTLVGVDLFDTRQQYIYDLRQSGGSVRVGRRLKWPDNYFYVQGLLRYQSNNVIEGRNFYREGKSTQYTLGATISRKNIDNPIFPSIGSNLSLDAEISGGPFLPGDVDYYKIGFKAEWYKRLFNSNRIALYTSADIGYLEELVKGTPVNPFEYYFMGGNGLVIATVPLRGYDDRSIGPKNFNGDVLGGRVMTKYTTELRFAVALEPIPLYLLAFAEAGNVFETLEQGDLFNLRRSVGFGARLLINPIGLIGFDLGYGFDKKAVDGKDPSWIFHFQFGRGF